jgi:hypothetical protein
MPVRILPGTPTLGGRVFWTDLVVKEGWRVQHNRILDAASPLKGYRLLDPQDRLWASADSVEELIEALPELMERFTEERGAMKREHVKRALGAALKRAAMLLERGEFRSGSGARRKR